MFHDILSKLFDITPMIVLHVHEKPGENFNFSIYPEFLAICSKSFRSNDTAECILTVHLLPKYEQTNLTLFNIISIVL